MLTFNTFINTLISITMRNKVLRISFTFIILKIVSFFTFSTSLKILEDRAIRNLFNDTSFKIIMSFLSEVIENELLIY